MIATAKRVYSSIILKGYTWCFRFIQAGLPCFHNVKAKFLQYRTINAKISKSLVLAYSVSPQFGHIIRDTSWGSLSRTAASTFISIREFNVWQFPISTFNSLKVERVRGKKIPFLLKILTGFESFLLRKVNVLTQQFLLHHVIGLTQQFIALVENVGLPFLNYKR